MLVRLATHTVSTLQFSLSLATALSLFVRLRCSHDTISWLDGWAIQWRPPRTLYNKPDVSSNPTALNAFRVQRLCERLDQRQALRQEKKLKTHVGKDYCRHFDNIQQTIYEFTWVKKMVTCTLKLNTIFKLFKLRNIYPKKVHMYYFEVVINNAGTLKPL